MTHTLTLRAIEPVTHDTNRLTFEKPDGFAFAPGQATEMHLEKDGWRDEARPFTFTSLPDADHLEFTIKSYPEHEGVTNEIRKMSPGDRVGITDPWGAIEDKGPGTFIAGGAGITPFIAILRARRRREGSLEGSRLFYANAEEKDIILREEWEAAPGLDCVFTLEEEHVEGLDHGRIDGAFLDRHGVYPGGLFYLCGPPPMEDAVTKLLADRGVDAERIVTEE